MSEDLLKFGTFFLCFSDLLFNGYFRLKIDVKMRQHLVTVCIVCILCATHTPCSAHQKDMSPTGPSPLDMGSQGTVHTHRQPERTGRDHEEEWDSKVS